MPFTFTKMSIPDVILVQPKVFLDPRGFFVELYKASDFRGNGIPHTFVQINQSRSQKNVLRGLHYQLNPKAQGKLVMVPRGEIYDVVVDIRKGSPTYGQWLAENLSDSNKKMIYVPEGFAHGFCALSEEVEIIYYCTEEYSPALERNILWNDKTININWPIQEPILSERDLRGKSIDQVENNFTYQGAGRK